MPFREEPRSLNGARSLQLRPKPQNSWPAGRPSFQANPPDRPPAPLCPLVETRGPILRPPKQNASSSAIPGRQKARLDYKGSQLKCLWPATGRHHGGQSIKVQRRPAAQAQNGASCGEGTKGRKAVRAGGLASQSRWRWISASHLT